MEMTPDPNVQVLNITHQTDDHGQLVITGTVSGKVQWITTLSSVAATYMAQQLHAVGSLDSMFGGIPASVLPVPPFVDGRVILRRLTEAVPALGTMVACPVALPHPGCGWECGSIGTVIQHLNDGHMWDRGRIADWLESLDVDLTFPVPT